MGLALGFHAPGEGFIDPDALKDTNHALVGAGGDGGMTVAERLGAFPYVHPYVAGRVQCMHMIAITLMIQMHGEIDAAARARF